MTDVLQDVLRTVWGELWQRIGAKGDPQVVWENLVARYSEDGRYYHTLNHIAHCLEELERVRHLCRYPNAVEMAIWFHDAVYDTHAEDNEEQSAKLALEVVKEAGLSEEFGQKVTALILATKRDRLPQSIDEQIITDIDLAILGLPDEQDVFGEYERQIRKEYAWVSDTVFARERAKLLRVFLARGFIFSTRYFRRKYEEAARENIRRSLSALDKMCTTG